MDSTFFKKSFSKFPTQTESVKKIIELVDNWTKKSKHHKGKKISFKLNDQVVNVFPQFTSMFLLVMVMNMY